MLDHLLPRAARIDSRASHGCMTSRGVQLHGSLMQTRCLLGAFEHEPWRSDILAAMAG